MGRIARKYNQAEYWHIMLRGIGHMDLFIDNADYIRFTDTLFRFTKEFDVPVHAYCLMSDHVHILINANTDTLSQLLKKIEVSYSYYFNQKYEHAGHLFQNRYRSEPILDDQYFLSAFRYILRNPENAGISKWNEYSWSSAKEYIDHKHSLLTDTGFITGILGSEKAVMDYVATPADTILCEPENPTFAIKDSEAKEIIVRLIGNDNPLTMQQMEKKARNTMLVSIKKAGLSTRQIERLTGINRNIIQRAK